MNKKEIIDILVKERMFFKTKKSSYLKQKQIINRNISFLKKMSTKLKHSLYIIILIKTIGVALLYFKKENNLLSNKKKSKWYNIISYSQLRKVYTVKQLPLIFLLMLLDFSNYIKYKSRRLTF